MAQPGGTLGVCSHIIGGEHVPSASGATFTTIDPAIGAAGAQVAHGDQADVDRAVAAARAAQPEWARMDPMERTRLLLRLAELIERNSAELAALESADVGKPIREAMSRDVPITVRTWIYWSGWPTKLAGWTNPADSGIFSYTLREPHGVVGAITPWNFPMVISAWKIAPALACGNTVVHKPSEDAPLSATRVAELALEAGFPPGVWNVVHGDGATGAAVAAHLDIDKVSFTGSTETGRRVQIAAAGNLKRLTLELGGKSANVVLGDADVGAAVTGALRATFRNQGQVCTAGGRLIVDAKVADELLERLVPAVGAMRIGLPSDPATEVGPLVSETQRDRVLSLFDAAVAEGAVAAVGGGPASVPGAPNGFFVEPTVFADTTNEMRINREEIFGPAVAVIRVGDVEEAVAVANDSDFGLAAAVWTRDVSKAHRVAQALDAGTVWVNTYGGLDPYAAYGGRHHSGYGYEQGPQAVDEYTTFKTVRTAL